MVQKKGGYMADRYVIAHELGHAVCAAVQDRYWKPIKLELDSDGSALAVCHAVRLEESKAISGRYSNTRDVMNLGGLFGEMAFQGRWSPWGARYDIDEFVIGNRTSRSKVKEELDSWLWKDIDKHSFRQCAKKYDIGNRFNFKLSEEDTKKRLPELYKIYEDFLKRIDIVSFVDAVEEIYNTGLAEVKGSRLRRMIREITGELP